MQMSPSNYWKDRAMLAEASLIRSRFRVNELEYVVDDAWSVVNSVSNSDGSLPALLKTLQNLKGRVGSKENG